MKLKNKWVGYIDRSYLQIKNSVLKRLGVLAPEITDHSESNVLVIIVSIFAGIAEMLNYYIDNMAREAFITTARLYKSVIRHAKLIDYRVKATVPASADVTIEFLDNNKQPVETTIAFTIPINTLFTTNNNTKFLSTNVINVPIGSTTINVPVKQYSSMDAVQLGTTDGSVNQKIIITPGYVDGSMELNVGGSVWALKNTLGRSGPTDKHFIVDISENKEAYILFGDGVNGMIPTPGQNVIGDYYTSKGKLGNVDDNTITSTDFDFSAVGDIFTKTNIYNINSATGGTDYESLERIKRSAPLHLRTLERAVTRQDYVDITMLAPGVDKATLHFECGKTIDIYISPNGGGIAQTPLIESTKEFIDNRKMITTDIRVSSAGESRIVLDISVKLQPGSDKNREISKINNALLTNYAYLNSDVNKSTYYSDIMGLVDNMDNVDYININKLFVIPYFRPLDHNNQVVPIMDINQTTPDIDWVLYFDGVNMRLYKGSTHIGIITIGTTYTTPDGEFTILIPPGTYNTSNRWEFTTKPININQVVTDHSVPTLSQDNLTINVI